MTNIFINVSSVKDLVAYFAELDVSIAFEVMNHRIDVLTPRLFY